MQIRLLMALAAAASAQFAAAGSDGEGDAGGAAAQVSPDVSEEQERVRREFHEMLAAALDPTGSWSAEVTETTTYPRDPHVEPVVVRSRIVVSDDQAVITPLGATAQFRSFVIAPSGGWILRGDGLSQEECPTGTVVWNLPFIFPTESTWRILDLARPEFWDEVRRRDDGKRVVFEIRTIIVRGGYSTYTIGFQRDGERIEVVAYDFKTWAQRPGGGDMRLVVSVSVTADHFVEVGGARVPAAVERRSWMCDSNDSVVVDAIQRTELSKVELPAPGKFDEVFRRAMEPANGQSVNIQGRNLFFIKGDRFFRVAGVLYEAPEPIESIPSTEELAALLERSVPVNRGLAGEAAPAVRP